MSATPDAFADPSVFPDIRLFVTGWLVFVLVCLGLFVAATVMADRSPRTTIDEVYGMLKYDGPPKTIEEMNEAVLAEARRRQGRS
jgi:hypothetical protein